ncbi:hypothetical protein PCE1_000384 [Barthelona sp. PCE]
MSFNHDVNTMRWSQSPTEVREPFDRKRSFAQRRTNPSRNSYNNGGMPRKMERSVSNNSRSKFQNFVLHPEFGHTPPDAVWEAWQLETLQDAKAVFMTSFNEGLKDDMILIQKYHPQHARVPFPLQKELDSNKNRVIDDLMLENSPVEFKCTQCQMIASKDEIATHIATEHKDVLDQHLQSVYDDIYARHYFLREYQPKFNSSQGRIVYRDPAILLFGAKTKIK